MDLSYYYHQASLPFHSIRIYSLLPCERGNAEERFLQNGHRPIREEIDLVSRVGKSAPSVVDILDTYIWGKYIGLAVDA